MTDTVGADWTRVERVRTHEQVLARIEQQILHGKLRPGARLPAERQLAEMLGVSRTAVRSALRILESMGIVEAGVGSGPSSGSTITGHTSPALTDLLRLHMALAMFTQREVTEVRIQLERWAAREAADQSRTEDLARLRGTVAAMRRTDLTSEEFNTLDTEFHVGIADCCGNSLLAHLMQTLRDLVHREMVTAFHALPDWRATASHLTDEHEDIIGAIEQGEGDRAVSLIDKHITAFYDNIQNPVSK